MRAAAILGLGSTTKDLQPFREYGNVSWTIGLPTAPSDADVILIFGGDGTVHRHLPQLVRLQRPVLVVPAGSGNDFARSLQLRSLRDSRRAWQKFASGKNNLRTIDLGKITPLASPGANPSQSNIQSFPAGSPYSVPAAGYLFACVAGCGLGSDIARRANTLPRWLRAHGGYALSLLPALARVAATTITLLRVPADAGLASSPDSMSRAATLVLCANAPFYGGGMNVAPQARMDDGQLDICLVNRVGAMRLLRLFPTVYFGRHLKVKEVEYFQAERLALHSETSLDIYADGEYVCQTPVEFGVARNALQVVTK